MRIYASKSKAKESKQSKRRCKEASEAERAKVATLVCIKDYSETQPGDADLVCSEDYSKAQPGQRAHAHLHVLQRTKRRSAHGAITIRYVG